VEISGKIYAVKPLGLVSFGTRFRLRWPAWAKAGAERTATTVWCACDPEFGYVAEEAAFWKQLSKMIPFREYFTSRHYGHVREFSSLCGMSHTLTTVGRILKNLAFAIEPQAKPNRPILRGGH
jgi:hypothetical protein